MSGNKTKLLITGGLGNLGSWITDYFSAKADYDVTVLSKNDRQLDIKHPFRKIFCDITDKTALQHCLADQEFDYIIHLASLNETFLDDYPRQAALINSYGTRNLLGVCENKKVKKFIYMSTFHVYGKDGGEITEQSSITPLNDYAITHYFAEEYLEMYARRTSLPYVILRLSNSYGCPKDVNSSKWYLLFNDLCRQAVVKKRIEIKSNGTALRDFVYMGDVCLAVDQMITNDNLVNEVFNLGSGESLSLAAMAEHIAMAYQERFSEKIEIVKNSDDRNVYPPVLTFSIEKLMKAIGFKPSFQYRIEAKRIFDFVVKHEKLLGQS